VEASNNALLSAAGVASVNARDTLQLGAGACAYLTAGQFASFSAPLSLLSQTSGTASHFAGNDMFLNSAALVSVKGDTLQLDSAGLLSIAGGGNLQLRGWQLSSLYATQEVDVATAGLLALRGSGFASMYGGNSLIAISQGVISISSGSTQDVFVNAGAGVSISGPSSIGMRTEGTLRALAGADLLASATGLASLQGGTSLLAMTNGQLVASAGGMVSLAAGRDLWMRAFSGQASLAATSAVQIRAGDVLSMFGTNSLIGVAAGPLSLFSNEQAVLNSDGVASVVGGNSLVLSSPGAAYLSSGGPVSVGSPQKLQLAGADIDAQAVHTVSLYGPDAVLGRSTTLLSMYADFNTGVGSGVDAILFGGSTATVSAVGAAVLYSGDVASLNGANSLMAATEGAFLTHAGGFASHYGTNSFIVTTMGDLYASTSTAARVVATDLALYAASSLNARAEVEADISSQTLRLLGNWLLDATANGPALLRSSADMVSIMGGGGSVIVVSPGTVSLAGGDSALLGGGAFASLSGGGSLALNAGQLLTANSNGDMALTALGALAMNAVGGALTGSGTSLSFYAATDGTVAAYQTLSLAAGTQFFVNTPTVSIHGDSQVLLDTFGDTSLSARGATNVWTGSSLLASTGCAVVAMAPHTSLYGDYDAILSSPALAAVASNALVSIGGGTTSVMAVMGVDVSAPTDGTGSLTASASTTSLFGVAQAELHANVVAALTSAQEVSLFAATNLAAASMGSTSFFSAGDTTMKQQGALFVQPTQDSVVQAGMNLAVTAGLALSLVASGTALLASQTMALVQSADMTSLVAASSLQLQSGTGPLSLYSPQQILAYADRDLILDAGAFFHRKGVLRFLCGRFSGGRGCARGERARGPVCYAERLTGVHQRRQHTLCNL